MNRFPLWKYCLLIAVMVLGFIYAMPNIYPDDPAVQISAKGAGDTVPESLEGQVVKALQGKGVEVKKAESTGKSLLIRLNSQDDQYKAQTIIQDLLDPNEYIAAVNLAPTTPQWLLDLGAQPMKLGLDLAGGVHFLLEVDTQKVLGDTLDGLVTQVRKELSKQRVYGVKVRREGNELVITSDSEEKRLQLSSFLRKEAPELSTENSQQGGSFVIRAFLTEQFIREKEDYAIKQNLTTLRKRVNEIGVSEPLVQRQGRNRIVVELPGIQDTARAKEIIGKTANLEFRLEATSSAFASQRENFKWRNERDQMLFGDASLQKQVIVTGENVQNAGAGFDPQTNEPQVEITLDGGGASRMNVVTSKAVGQRMGVLFIEFDTKVIIEINEQGEEVKKNIAVPNPRVINLATIRSALGKKFVITGLDSPQESSELALLLRAGALAAPMSFVEERTIGPSLGAENIADGVRSVKIGLALVLIFMIVFYKVFGVAANLALTLNMLLLAAIMSLFGATLTLPGIAGIVLTVGMAVDANVLIFSRIKEEIKAGSPPQTSIKNGFDSAFITIVDANLTTFIVAIILYAIGSGPVKGFAVTLAIGILTSMFTAIVGTRAVVNLIYGNRNVNKLMI